MNVESKLITLAQLSSPTDTPLTPKDKAKLLAEIGSKFISSPDVLITEFDRKQLITTQNVYGVTAGALTEPEPLRDFGPGTPHPITGRKFSSTQFNMPFDIALRIKEIGIELVPDDDLSIEVKDVVAGRETVPHITIKYGIHAEYPDDVERVLVGIGPIEVTIGETFIFDSADEYDVVNLKIISPALVKLNSIISQSTQVTDTRPKYIPHLCLAYVHKGMGKKYVGIRTDLTGHTIVLDTVLFSSRNGEEFFIPLSEVVHEEKGGSGSGNFGHAGRPGQVGGSAPSGKPKPQFDKEMKLYHGTTTEASKSILKYGLKRSSKRNWDIGGEFAETRRVSVYLTKDLDSAEYYAVNAVMIQGLNQTVDELEEDLEGIDYAELGLYPITLEITIPEDKTHLLHQDEEEPTGLRFEGDIPPEWIQIHDDTKAASSKIYGVLIVDERKVENSKGGAGSGHFGHSGRPGSVGGSAPSKHTNIQEDSGGEVELGKPFLVYRLGSAKGSLDGRNGANANGLGDHLVRLSDMFAPSFASGQGDTISVYAVTLNSQPATYQRAVGGAGIDQDNVGREVSRSGDDTQIVYSFPKSGGDHETELLTRIPLTELRKKLNQYGYNDPDDAGIRETARAIRELTYEKLGYKGGAGSGHFGHAGRPGLVGGSAPSGSNVTDEDAHYLRGWTEGDYDWSEMQHAAKAVIDGTKRDEYICYDCRGNDGHRYDIAKRLLEIAETQLIDKSLYRGLSSIKAGQFRVGKTFSESLTSWTGNRLLAFDFANGDYGGPELEQGNSSVVLLLKGTGMHGVNISQFSDKEPFKSADEYLTSGEYIVESKESFGSYQLVTVKRIGNAQPKNLRKSFDEKGGPGSGHFGHSGRPGEVGGSLPSIGGSQAGETGLGSSGAGQIFEMIGRNPSSDTNKIQAKFENMIVGGRRLSRLAQTDKELKDQLGKIGSTAEAKYLVDNYHDRAGSRTTPNDDTEYGAQAVVAKLTSSWAGSSTNQNATSLAMQLAVANKFGLESDHIEGMAKTATFARDPARFFGLEQSRLSELDAVDAVRAIANSPAVKAYVDEVYRETQLQLAEQDIDRITVYRGMNWPNEYSVPESLSLQGAQSFTANPLSSFTVARDIANDFATDVYAGGGRRLLSTTIPRSRVFSTPRSGLGALDEYEVVVVGGILNVDVDKL